MRRRSRLRKIVNAFPIRCQTSADDLARHKQPPTAYKPLREVKVPMTLPTLTERERRVRNIPARVPWSLPKCISAAVHRRVTIDASFTLDMPIIAKSLISPR